MKQTEKNSSKVNNVNNETLSPETIKAQLKSACVNMNAKETKDYIKSLDGYELRLTGQKPTQHYTVFYGEIRICNVEQVQGIKADGTSRGCVSTAKVNFFDTLQKLYVSKLQKLREDLIPEENNGLEELECELYSTAAKIQEIFDGCNNRIAEKEKEAAKLKRDATKGAKMAENATLSQLQLAILKKLLDAGLSEEEAKKRIIALTA